MSPYPLERRIKLLPETSTRKIFDRLTPGNLLLLGGIKGLEWLVRCGITPQEDGFRRYARAYLRGEESRIVLAAFGLDISFVSLESVDALRKQIAEKLLAIFSMHHELFDTQLEWHRNSVKIVPCSRYDIVHVQFDEDGNLTDLATSFDPHSSSPGFVCDAKQIFINAYNHTRHLQTRQRPFIFLNLLKPLKETYPYLERIASATWIHFEPFENSKRFESPNFSIRRPPGPGLLNICCRYNLSDAYVDLWFQFSHTLTDGNPAADLVSIIKNEWKERYPLIIPAAGYLKEDFSTPPTDSTKCWAHSTMVLSFESLIANRRRLRDKFAGQDLEVPISSLLAWSLAKHPNFRNSKFTIMVDLLPRPKSNDVRTSCSVVIRPNKYYHSQDLERSFVDYLCEFNQQLNALRQRTAAIYRVMSVFALMPPTVYELCWSVLRSSVSQIVGTPTITILRDSDMFIAPRDITRYGVFAIGNMCKPTEDGNTGGLVNIWTSPHQLASHEEAIQQAVSEWHL